MSWSDLWRLIAAGQGDPSAPEPPISSVRAEPVRELSLEEAYEVYVDDLRGVLNFAGLMQSCINRKCQSERTTLTSYERAEGEPTVRVTCTCLACDHHYVLQVDDIIFVGMFALHSYAKAQLWDSIDELDAVDQITWDRDES